VDEGPELTGLGLRRMPPPGVAWPGGRNGVMSGGGRFLGGGGGAGICIGGGESLEQEACGDEAAAPEWRCRLDLPPPPPPPSCARRWRRLRRWWCR